MEAMFWLFWVVVWELLGVVKWVLNRDLGMGEMGILKRLRNVGIRLTGTS